MILAQTRRNTLQGAVQCYQFGYIIDRMELSGGLPVGHYWVDLVRRGLDKRDARITRNRGPDSARGHRGGAERRERSAIGASPTVRRHLRDPLGWPHHLLQFSVH